MNWCNVDHTYLTVSSIIVNNTNFPSNGTTNDVGGIISANSKKNTVNDSKIDILNDTCNQENGRALINRNKTVANWKATEIKVCEWRRKGKGEKAEETNEEQEICLITFPDSIRTHDAMTLMLVMVVMAIAVGMVTATIKQRRKRDKKNWCKWDVYKSMRKKLISFPFLFCFYCKCV